MRLTRQSRRGFTLIEPLIALLVLSLGLLGAAGMLLESVRDHASAVRRLAAIHLARDLADRIRANPRARVAYAAEESDAPESATEESTQPSGALCVTTCSAVQRATLDLHEWHEAAARALPAPADGALARIQFVPATGPTLPDGYVITLRWRDPRLGDRADTLATRLWVLAPVAG